MIRQYGERGNMARTLTLELLAIAFRQWDARVNLIDDSQCGGHLCLV